MGSTVVPGETTPSETAASDPAALLAAGLFADACAAVRQARRRAFAGRSPSLFSLLECEALAALGRDAEAVGVATRALSRTPADRDHAVRLRVARALALWHTGRVAAARGEARRALDQSEEPLTRARALEALGLSAWKDDQVGTGRDLLRQAAALYEAGGSAAGVVRAAGLVAELEREAWRFAEALALHDHRTALALQLGRPHLLAEVHLDHAALLAAMGRWSEAAEALEVGQGWSDEEPVAAGLLRATLARARGDLGAAQRALAAARGRLAGARRPRVLADWHVLASDVALAAADAASAEREALEAIRLFGLVAERGGRCRGRVRRVHALLALGQENEAVVEARRAVADAAADRPGLRAHAGLSLARVLVRTSPAAAEKLCASLAEWCRDHRGFLAVARFGQALAGGAAQEILLERLADVESWGDRRVLAYCLTELRHARPEDVEGDAAEPPAAESRTPAPAVDPTARALVGAIHALADEGPWPERWSAAVRALSPVVPWFRAAYVGQPAYELRHDDEHARPLAASDLAHVLAARVVRPPEVVDLQARSDLRLHPTRALHGLRVAVVAPAAPQAWVYFDFREGQGPPSDGQVAAVVELGRLLGRFPARAEVAPEAAEVTATGMVGDSSAMQSLFQTIGRVARFDLAVHVCGETGTGKERVAHALHQLSARAARPFVAVNASSLGDDLFESEMFGHLRGSFTGAVGDREGHVAAAEGGTLFLDEVTDLSPRAQAKLLRLLEQKEYRRVGESRTRQADVRFVTASNVPLEARVGEGRFRADLMYRLNRLVLTVPALRERSDDVAPLARHFLRRAAARAGVPVPALAPEAERALRAHAWPGNVRELENEMARLVVMGCAGRIRRAHLAPGLLEGPAPGTAPLREALWAFEREHIARVLRQHGGNRARTACVLGLSRQALVAKISRLGIG
jgi:two-component system NtrC family response regulator